MVKWDKKHNHTLIGWFSNINYNSQSSTYMNMMLFPSRDIYCSHQGHVHSMQCILNNAFISKIWFVKCNFHLQHHWESKLFWFVYFNYIDREGYWLYFGMLVITQCIMSTDFNWVYVKDSRAGQWVLGYFISFVLSISV